jgi:hypothetical protein
MKIRFSLLITYLLLSFLSGCIVLPVEKGEEEHLTDEKLTFIEIGMTSKEELAARMADFPIPMDDGVARASFSLQEFHGGNLWLYMQTRSEAKWLVVLLAAGDGHIDVTGDFDYRFLLVKFDENGVVAEYDLLSSEGDGCNRQGVCVRDSHYALLATDDEDQTVKQFSVPADLCGVYVYGKPTTSIPIWLDDHRLGWLLDNKQFFFSLIDPGRHELSTSGTDWHPIGGEVIEMAPNAFNCSAGDLYFFDIRVKHKGFIRPSRWIDIEPRDAVRGRKAISRRRLTLSGTVLLD